MNKTLKVQEISRMKLKTPFNSSFNGLWALIALSLIPSYFLIPLYKYSHFELLAFDFGILLENSQKLSHSFVNFLYSRGLANWADKENYMSILLMPLNFLPHPIAFHVLLHSLLAYLPGWILFFAIKEKPLKYWLPIFYWLSPGIFWLNQDLIHIEGFVPFFILLGFAFWKNKKANAFLLCWTLAILCKEDVAVSLGVASVILYFVYEKEKKLLYFTALCLFVFVMNRFVILPAMRDYTCEVLGSGQPTQHKYFSHTAPWFNNLSESIFTLKFWVSKFEDQKNVIYSSQILWPLCLLLLFIRSYRWIALLILPVVGVVINILGGAYLIQLHYHYDHTTTSLLIISLWLLFGEIRKPRLALGLFVVGFVIQMATFQAEIPKSIWAHFLSTPNLPLRENPSTRWTLEVGKRLPADTVVSADYNSLVYVLQPSLKVFMFENPFKETYFGFYGTCTQLNPKVEPDVVILRGKYPNQELIPSYYTKHKFSPAPGHEFDVWFKPGTKARLLPILEQIKI